MTNRALDDCLASLDAARFACRSVWKRNTWQLKAFALHIPSFRLCTLFAAARLTRFAKEIYAHKTLHWRNSNEIFFCIVPCVCMSLCNLELSFRRSIFVLWVAKGSAHINFFGLTHNPFLSPSRQMRPLKFAIFVCAWNVIDGRGVQFSKSSRKESRGAETRSKIDFHLPLVSLSLAPI